MKRLSTFLALALALATSPLLAAEKPVHLFILSGQSNMAGMNPQLGFVPETKALFPAADVAFIKVAKGGQPIRFWVDQWNAIATKHKLTTKRAEPSKVDYYQDILRQYKEMLAKHPNPTSVTFCWMQGERDAREKLNAAYQDALAQLITNLRRDLKQPEMNIVIARLSDHGKPDYKSWQDIREIQVRLAKNDKRGAWVDCDDLNDKMKAGKTYDDLHYTKQGYELLGRRYARQAKALIEGEQPAQNGRPE